MVSLLIKYSTSIIEYRLIVYFSLALQARWKPSYGGKRGWLSNKVSHHGWLTPKKIKITLVKAP